MLSVSATNPCSYYHLSIHYSLVDQTHVIDIIIMAGNEHSVFSNGIINKSYVVLFICGPILKLNRNKQNVKACKDNYKCSEQPRTDLYRAVVYIHVGIIIAIDDLCCIG